jgi:DNA (cytosine-5)-methyltransferase 1
MSKTAPLSAGPAASASRIQDPESSQLGGLIEDYAFEDAILNAADFGAFQARKRAVVIGYRRDLEFPGFPLPTHHAQPTTLNAHKTVRQAFAGIPTLAANFDLPNERSVTINGDTFNGPLTPSELHFGRNYSQLSLDRFAVIKPGGNRFQLPP